MSTTPSKPSNDSEAMKAVGLPGGSTHPRDDSLPRVNRPSLLDQAITYALKGYPVFPCHTRRDDGRCTCGRLHNRIKTDSFSCDLDPEEGKPCSCGKVHEVHKVGKHPVIELGFLKASTDSKKIKSWWTKHPWAAIGCATGKSFIDKSTGLMVVTLDLDAGMKPDHDMNGFQAIEAMEAIHGKLPTTKTMRTGGGGLQHFFLIPNGIEVRNRGGLRLPDGRRCAVDVRASGGYTILPGSLHPSGMFYEWEVESDIVPAPEWLIDWMTKRWSPPASEVKTKALPAAKAGGMAPHGASGNVVSLMEAKYCRKVLENACEEIRNAQKGSRHKTITRLAETVGGYVHYGYYTEEEAIEALATAGTTSGKDAREARRAARDCVLHGMSRPLMIPELASNDGMPGPPPDWLSYSQAAYNSIIEKTGEDDTIGEMISSDEIEESITKENPDPETLKGLVKRKGRVAPTLWNAVQILENDRRMSGSLIDDKFAHVVRWNGEEMTDAMETEINLWFADSYRMTMPTAKVREAVICVAARHPRHPVQDWLLGLKWDGGKRLNDWMSRCLEVTPAIYKKIGRMWMVSAVARALRPGCKVDTSLILFGPQGAFKSTVFRTLVPEPTWFSDSAIDLRSKDAMDALAGIWIYELSELDSVRKSETTAVKAFLSSQDDRFRPAYGRNKVRYARQCVIVGSTNEKEFLTDPTGSRRFWPVHVRQIDLKAIENARDQLWAEAVHAFNQGERWWLDHSDEQEMAAISARYQSIDVWEDLVAEYLNMRTKIQITDILTEAIRMDVAKQGRSEQMRIGAILRRLGWERKRPRVNGEYKYYYYPPGSEIEEEEE